MKHFNSANVWGRVSSVKEEKSDKGVPYLVLQIDCANELYGNVRAYGRLWGSKKLGVVDRSKLDAFLQAYRKDSGAAFRFRGFFSQYDDREGRRLSNFTFFSWSLYDGREMRATCVLVGEVTAIESEGGERRLHMYLVREGQGNYPATTENFVVYAFIPQETDGFDEGDVVEAAVILRAREAADAFGRQSGTIRPYAMELKKRTQTEEDAGSSSPYNGVPPEEHASVDVF